MSACITNAIRHMSYADIGSMPQSEAAGAKVIHTAQRIMRFHAHTFVCTEREFCRARRLCCAAREASADGLPKRSAPTRFIPDELMYEPGPQCTATRSHNTTEH